VNSVDHRLSFVLLFATKLSGDNYSRIFKIIFFLTLQIIRTIGLCNVFKHVEFFIHNAIMFTVIFDFVEKYHWISSQMIFSIYFNFLIFQFTVLLLYFSKSFVFENQKFLVNKVIISKF